MHDIAPDVREAAAAVDLLAMDVDGVLTGGEIIYGPGGEWKVFSVKDGHGFRLAAQAGLKTAVITGRRSAAVLVRARELGVSAVLQGVTRKGRAVEELCAKLGIGLDAVCFVGDDLVDLPVMRRVGFPVAVADAVEEVRAAARWITASPGGRGAVREVIELLLKARGDWDSILQRTYGE